jgi:ribosome maturation factor RimP
MRKDLKDLWLLTEPYVRDAGFDLIEVTSGREATGWVLRLFIDVPAGASVTVSHDDCARVSRDVSAALDVADSIPHAYQLELSSPGLDRPLRREGDFARFAGHNARVRLSEQGGQAVGGRRNFSGTIRSAKDGHEEIAKANLVPDWEREFHRSAS